jgi:peptidoglycan/LPS O-acetylase OafA/YrhL
VSRRGQLAVVAVVAALWFGIPAAVLASITTPGDKPSVIWLALLIVSVLGLGAVCGATVRPRESVAWALAVAAALALGFDIGITAAFATGTSCGTVNGSACDTAAGVGAVLIAPPAFCVFLLAVLVGRVAVHRGRR